MRGILLQILGLVCGRHEAKLQELCARGPAANAQMDALQRVMRYVRDNLDKQMTLGDAAAAAFLSPNYLAHVLKKQTNRTFTELVTERRVELAKELLIGTRLQVRDVARKCGFSDEAYFNRRFRRAVGSAPGEFRTQNASPFLSA
jgi:AraC-like DNA-binding protein